MTSPAPGEPARCYLDPACPTCQGPREHMNEPCRSRTAPDSFHFAHPVSATSLYPVEPPAATREDDEIREFVFGPLLDSQHEVVTHENGVEESRHAGYFNGNAACAALKKWLASRPSSTRGETAGAGLIVAAALEFDREMTGLLEGPRTPYAHRLHLVEYLAIDAKARDRFYKALAAFSDAMGEAEDATPVPPQGETNAEPVPPDIKRALSRVVARAMDASHSWIGTEAREYLDAALADLIVAIRRATAAAPPRPAPDSEVEKARRAFYEAVRTWFSMDRVAKHPPFPAISESDWTRMWSAMNDAYDALLAAEKAAAERGASSSTGNEGRG